MREIMNVRDILFRGKSKEKNLWVYGNLYIKSNGDAEILRYCNEGNFEYHSYEVVRNTVGQFTGLTDRNGKMIFEGDIVTGIAYSQEWVGNIIWIKEIASFGLYHGHDVAWENSSILKRVAKGINDEFSAEIIGNIYDNPELLKRGDKT